MTEGALPDEGLRLSMSDGEVPVSEIVPVGEDGSLGREIGMRRVPISSLISRVA